MTQNLLTAARRAAPPVLRKKAAHKYSYGRCSLHYMVTVKKWRQHFRGVVISIFQNAKRFGLPVTFDPIEQYMSGFEVQYHEITDLPSDLLARYRAPDEIAEGWNFIDQGIIHIFYDPTMQPERIRMTIAHEWGHVIQRLDGEFMADMEAMRDTEERDAIIESLAYKFANDYLMPEPVVRHKWLELQKWHEVLPNEHVASIAHTFSVSFTAMQNQLSYCQLRIQQ